MAEDMLVMTMGQVEDFLGWQSGKRRAPGTIERYRYDLTLLFDWLPADKVMTDASLPAWRDSLLSGGASDRTVKSRLAAANSFLNYMGCRNLMLCNYQGKVEREQDGSGQFAALTRAEYLRLLQTAAARNNCRSYLLIKVFGTMGMAVHDLPNLTAEAVRAGTVQISDGSGRLAIPAPVREELLAYMGVTGVGSGPVFLARTGVILNRTSVTAALKSIGAAAGIEPEKVTPRNLRRMYQATQEEILQNLFRHADAEYGRLLLEEQETAGWQAAGREDPAPMKQPAGETVCI